MTSIETDTGIEGAIAVIGMAGRFPGARNVEQFWQNLCNGVESITFFTEQDLEALQRAVNYLQWPFLKRLIRQPNYVNAKPIIEEPEFFDAAFFGLSSGEAELMDPQHRLFLECSWEALENAGYAPENYPGLVGVFAGMLSSSYFSNQLALRYDLLFTGRGFQAGLGTQNDYLASRVSYKLNLKGPSVNVQSACSTSLVAIHLACQALLNHECDMALAGGVQIEFPLKIGHTFQEGNLSCPDGHCRAFDARAQGTIFGNGLGVVVLKRLADALADGDRLDALVLGSAINNDGSVKAGYTAPGIEGQAAVAMEALANAGVTPETIGYIEAHGTGTALGDPIEVAALTRVFRTDTDRKAFCAIGSVKTNVGHLGVAAGVTGFIKAVLTLKHDLIPPSLHFEQPNPRIDFVNSPFYVNTRLAEWKRGGAPRRAGVSSFGMGGTNAHVILQEAPVLASDPAQPWQLLVLSAKTDTALAQMTARLAAYLKQQPDLNLADVAFTLQLGRQAFRHRRALVGRDMAEAIRLLEAADPKQVLTHVQEPGTRQVAFMFSGQGAQYVTMGLELYQDEPVFREQVARCCLLLKPHLGLDLRQVLYPSQEMADEAGHKLDQTHLTQPALFVIEYALARLWQSWGVQPQAMIGHSIGEYVAACLAGVLSLEDALRLVAARGRLMQTMPAGAMLSVSLSPDALIPLLGQALSLAAVNGPASCVASGPLDAIEQLEARLTGQEIACRRLHTSHAFHSAMMDPILAPFTREVERVTLRPPRVPFLSNVTGAWITAAEATDPAYWARHLRQAVHFAEGVGELFQEPNRVLLEVGPGRTLSSLARRHPAKAPTHVVVTSLRHPQDQSSDTAWILGAVGQLWLAGVPLDWAALHAGTQRRRVALPSYPFERRRYWVDPPMQGEGPAQALSSFSRPDIEDWFYLPVWKRTSPPHLLKSAAPLEPSWLLLADTRGLGDRLATSLQAAGCAVTIVQAGDCFCSHGDSHYTLNPDRPDDYAQLVQTLRAAGPLPGHIVHLWCLDELDHRLPEEAWLDRAQALGFYSLLFLAQALGKHNVTQAMRVGVVSNQVYDVTGQQVAHPEQAVMLGPCLVIPAEYPNIACRHIDVCLADDAGLPDLANQLIAEMAIRSDDTVVAYRGRHRWVQTFEPTRLGAPDSSKTHLRQNGVYLITGGLGGIGLAVAEHLARGIQARLALVGRSAFPAHQAWADWLTTHDGHDPTSRQIHKLQAMEAAGAEVLVLSADVTDRVQLQAVVEAVTARFGAIHGVIHSAGVAGGGLIQLKTPQAAAAVLGPKVRGAWALAEALAAAPLDFMVLCSSLYSITGGLGQVDYCGGNAFMDAFAHYHTARRGVPTISINWDAWEEVGMAFEAALRQAGGSRQHDEAMHHPLLTRRTIEPSGVENYPLVLSAARHWVLDEHRLMGEPLVPGVTWLEVARAALAERAGERAIELRDVFFITPLRVPDGEHKAARLMLRQDGDAFELSVASQVGSAWQEHVSGRVAVVEVGPCKRWNVQEIVAQCQAGFIAAEQWAQERQKPGQSLTFGAHWQVVQAVHLAQDSAVARLELPEHLAAELADFKLHPALLDVATSYAVGRIGSAARWLYLPLSYKLLRINAPLTRVIYSYARCAGEAQAGEETITFDVTLLDESGTALVEVEGFTLKRVGDNLPRPPAPGAPAQAAPSATPALVGIRPPEGAEALVRILAADVPSQVIVSLRPPQALIEQVRRPGSAATPEAPNAAESQPAQPRPSMQTPYVAPQSALEQSLATLWQQVLGLEAIGVHDNFFELGGDSVLGIQLVTKAKRAGLSLTPPQLFQHPTLSELAALARPTETTPAADLPEAPVPPAPAGAYTPADFPEAGLNQRDLDKFMAQLNQQ